MKGQPLTDEAWREYEFGPPSNRVFYRIDNPQALFMRPGGTTHRVLDAHGIVHCVPAVGECWCVLRWCPKPGTAPVAF